MSFPFKEADTKIRVWIVPVYGMTTEFHEIYNDNN